jgi:hypothetical protein
MKKVSSMDKQLSGVKGRVLLVDQSHAKAADRNPGTARLPFRTINAAAQTADPGDTVFVKRGIYREWVQPAKSGAPDAPIVYQAEESGSVVVKGSEILEGNWQPVAGNADVFSISLDHPVLAKAHAFLKKRASKAPDFVDWVTRYSLGQVFVNGTTMRQVLSPNEMRLCPSSWFVDDASHTLVVRFPAGHTPAKAEVEVSVRPRIFAPTRRGLGHIAISGFVFEHCANTFPRHFWQDADHAQAGAVGFGSGHHWTLEHCVVRLAGMTGVDCGSETGAVLNGQEKPPLEEVGYHLIRNNLIERNGSAGIIGWQHRETRVVGNVIRDNNTLGILAWETGGIKFHGFHDGVIRDNLIEDNDTWGIWFDNVYRGSRIEGNLILGNMWGGIFLEMGSGPVYIVNNIVAHSVSGDEYRHRGGHGIYGHDAGGAKIYHNLFYGNAGFGVTANVVCDRPGGVHDLCEASDWDVRNNLFIGNKLGHLAFTVPCLRSRNNLADHNIYMNGNINPGTGFFGINTVNTPATPGFHAKGIREYLKALIEDKAVDRQTELIIENWTTLPYLTFKQWTSIMDMDKNSRLLPAHSDMTLRRKLYQWQMSPELDIYRTRFPALPAVASDYFGQAMGDSVFAGPFQPERTPPEIFHLWPKE